jgi:hypothetical protein
LYWQLSCGVVVRVGGVERFLGSGSSGSSLLFRWLCCGRYGLGFSLGTNRSGLKTLLLR